MASSNKTEKYGLNQWESGDRPKRTDFNEDNEKLEATLNELSEQLDNRVEKFVSSGGTQIQCGNSIIGMQSDGTMSINHGNPGSLVIQGDGSMIITAIRLTFDATWVMPAPDNTVPLGRADLRWKEIYIGTAPVVGSDRTLKDKITPLDEETAIRFILALNPSSYELLDSGKEEPERRTHWGLIAQDVEQALYINGMNTLDFAGLICSPIMEEIETGEYTEETFVDETGKEQKIKAPVMKTVITGERYGLRYEEFIAPLIRMVQVQQGEIEDLKSRVEMLEAKVMSL